MALFEGFFGKEARKNRLKVKAAKELDRFGARIVRADLCMLDQQNLTGAWEQMNNQLALTDQVREPSQIFHLKNLISESRRLAGELKPFQRR